MSVTSLGDKNNEGSRVVFITEILGRQHAQHATFGLSLHIHSFIHLSLDQLSGLIESTETGSSNII